MVGVIGVIEQLRQNDPARTRIWINLCDETSDADEDADHLAQALEQNPFVTAISFILGVRSSKQIGIICCVLLRCVRT